MWVGKADAQTLSRWTPLQRGGGVTGGGKKIGGPAGSGDPTSLWHRSGDGALARNPPCLGDKSEKLHTRYLSGCGTGGEEDGGEVRREREKGWRGGRGGGAAEVKEPLAYKTVLAAARKVGRA